MTASCRAAATAATTAATAPRLLTSGMRSGKRNSTNSNSNNNNVLFYQQKHQQQKQQQQRQQHHHQQPQLMWKMELKIGHPLQRLLKIVDGSHFLDFVCLLLQFGNEMEWLRRPPPPETIGMIQKSAQKISSRPGTRKNRIKELGWLGSGPEALKLVGATVIFLVLLHSFYY